MPPDPGSALVLGFAALFDGIGTETVRYSAAAQSLSGREIVIEGFVAHAHGPGAALLLVNEPGLCPDCSPAPAAVITLQGGGPILMEGDPRPVRVSGRLDYGFRIDGGTASMLRIEGARLHVGASA